jgi:hypothetical protein
MGVGNLGGENWVTDIFRVVRRLSRLGCCVVVVMRARQNRAGRRMVAGGGGRRMETFGAPGETTAPNLFNREWTRMDANASAGMAFICIYSRFASLPSFGCG